MSRLLPREPYTQICRVFANRALQSNDTLIDGALVNSHNVESVGARLLRYENRANVRQNDEHLTREEESVLKITAQILAQQRGHPR